MRKVVLVTGGFDPLHSGHLEYFKAAKALGDILIVGVNSDEWLTRKKGRPFMPLAERKSIIEHLSMVDRVITFNDHDNSACDAIISVRQSYLNDHIIFANGGDRTTDNIPEMNLVSDKLEFVFGVGGENKLNSSSWLLDEWKYPKTERPWGNYRVIYDHNGTKVKELTVMPGKSLTMQRHKFRSEHWHVVEGMCDVNRQMDLGYTLPSRLISKHQTVDIAENEWHQLHNPYSYPCKIVEIQFGAYCDEEDIERK
jgi:cytidyltransferase-like protein